MKAIEGRHVSHVPSSGSPGRASARGTSWSLGNLERPPLQTATAKNYWSASARSASPCSTARPPDHTLLTNTLRAYLAWRNANPPDLVVLAAERERRAEARAETGRRWGRPPARAAETPLN